ncbi:hypothetical protein [Halogeometricum limi]|uniref:Uncharacterized protein n=1 Tax=Halogeometricum limi TaxID=555875 RepID=A0A1I6FVX6_9EURY|nr:hypothetical protein [Halogeometricum limi]SFR34074.1 hypothetical protein SAMN04488124_0402 [Halogeometricum limi]
MPVGHQGTKRTIRLYNGERVGVEISSDRNFSARIDITHDGTRWSYGVVGDDVRLITAFDDDECVEEPDDPDFLQDVLLEIGL